MHRTIRTTATSRTANRGRQPARAGPPLRSGPLGDCRGRPCGKSLTASRKAGRPSTEARARAGEPLRCRGESVRRISRVLTGERRNAERACNRGGVHTRLIRRDPSTRTGPRSRRSGRAKRWFWSVLCASGTADGAGAARGASRQTRPTLFAFPAVVPVGRVPRRPSSAKTSGGAAHESERCRETKTQGVIVLARRKPTRAVRPQTSVLRRYAELRSLG